MVNNPAATLLWTKYTVPYTALQTAALTNAPVLFVLPAKGIVHAVKQNVTTLFSGSGIVTITLSVGTGGNVTKYLVATTLASTSGTDGVGLSVPAVESYSGTTNVVATATAVGANLSLLTQGSVDIYVLASQLP